MRERLELRRQNHVDEHQREAESERQVAEGATHLFILSAHIDAQVEGRRHRGQFTLHGGDGTVQPS